MRLLFLALLGLLTGCDSPSPAFRGIEGRQVVVEKSVFSVRVKGDLIEAIRTNVEYAPTIGKLFPRFRIAMEQASGCRVIENSMRGDQALMHAKLDCQTARARVHKPASDQRL